MNVWLSLESTYIDSFEVGEGGHARGSDEHYIGGKLRRTKHFECL